MRDRGNSNGCSWGSGSNSLAGSQAPLRRTDLSADTQRIAPVSSVRVTGPRHVQLPVRLLLSDVPTDLLLSGVPTDPNSTLPDPVVKLVLCVADTEPYGTLITVLDALQTFRGERPNALARFEVTLSWR